MGRKQEYVHENIFIYVRQKGGEMAFLLLIDWILKISSQRGQF